MNKAVLAYLEQMRVRLALPGVAVGIVQDGQVVFLHGFGTSTKDPITERTPFIIGSLSKSLTALAIMQLVEAGKLGIYDPVQKYLPWFRVDAPRHSVGSERLSAGIKIQHLLAHMSGLPRYEGRALLSSKGGKTREQVVRALRYVKLFSPIGITEQLGSIFQYSNLNYAVLGLLIEVVSGQSYEEYLQEHIFRPLGMQSSFTSELPAMEHGLSQGYRWWFGFPIPFTASYLSEAVPAAFVISTVEDMTKYLLACLDAGRSEGAILSAASFQKMFLPQGINLKGAFDYGFGWRVGLQMEEYGGEKILRHGGEVSNFRADMVLVPGQKLGVVVLANCNNGLVAQLGLDQLALPLVRLLLGLPLPRPSLSKRYFSSLLILAVMVLSAIQGHSLLRFLRSEPSQTRKEKGILALLCDLLAPLLIVWRVPKVVDMSWQGLLLYVPDVSRWLLLMSGLSLLRGLLRLWRFFNCSA